MDDGPDQDLMIPSSRAIMDPGFDATKERIGSGYNRYFVVPFGGQTTWFTGSRVITVYPTVSFSYKTAALRRCSRIGGCIESVKSSRLPRKAVTVGVRKKIKMKEKEKKKEMKEKWRKMKGNNERGREKALTIGQMQGKFQMLVVRHTGHAIQVLCLQFLLSCIFYQTVSQDDRLRKLEVWLMPIRFGSGCDDKLVSLFVVRLFFDPAIIPARVLLFSACTTPISRLYTNPCSFLSTHSCVLPYVKTPMFGSLTHFPISFTPAAHLSRSLIPETRPELSLSRTKFPPTTLLYSRTFPLFHPIQLSLLTQNLTFFENFFLEMEKPHLQPNLPACKDSQLQLHCLTPLADLPLPL
ncbi:protein phosphatase methylesterase 1 [Dendrobium catenatum]|uniref:Protein phosphatase methylesterase 1 n=1 Tax=Dendrobium catenatum TaxID=906689 RepID=A0A2I0VMW8_9ASPA|nr:protein phosphatase methylesterase 1 [Dendrobium catenatum]